MVRPRHCVPIRLLALVLLLWVGFDVGAHGFLTSDFAFPAAGARATLVAFDGQVRPAPAAHDHCFCGGIFEGATAPAPAETLIPTGAILADVVSRAPRADGHPLDRPPQLIA